MCLTNHKVANKKSNTAKRNYAINIGNYLIRDQLRLLIFRLAEQSTRKLKFKIAFDDIHYAD